MYNECADYKGKDWCATEVDAKSKTYKTFGWCEKDKCKEVDEAAEMVKKIQAGGESSHGSNNFTLDNELFPKV